MVETRSSVGLRKSKASNNISTTEDGNEPTENISTLEKEQTKRNPIVLSQNSPSCGKKKTKKYARRRKVGTHPKTVNQVKDHFVREHMTMTLGRAFLKHANMLTFEHEQMAKYTTPVALVYLDQIVDKPYLHRENSEKLRDEPKISIFSNTKRNAKRIKKALKKAKNVKCFTSLSDRNAFHYGAPDIMEETKTQVEDLVSPTKKHVQCFASLRIDRNAFPYGVPDIMEEDVMEDTIRKVEDLQQDKYYTFKTVWETPDAKTKNDA